MRGALTMDAQRAAGAILTAESFIRTIRRHFSSPPLRVIVYVVPGSMGRFAAPAVSLIWQPELAGADRFHLEYGYHLDRPGSCPSTTRSQPGRVPRWCGRFAEDLIKRLQSNGGARQVENQEGETQASCQRAIYAVKQHGLRVDDNPRSSSRRLNREVPAALNSSTSYPIFGLAYLRASQGRSA